MADLVITRTYDAPRERVWSMWTNAEKMQKWWGPKEFSVPTYKLDLTIGGTYLYCMGIPGSEMIWSGGEYKEIVPHERLVFTDHFADKDGNKVSGTVYGMPSDFPLEMTVTVTLEDTKDPASEFSPIKTKMTLRQGPHPAGEIFTMARAGWSESFEKLAELLKE